MVEMLASLKPFNALQHWMASGSEVAGAIKEFQDQQQWAKQGDTRHHDQTFNCTYKVYQRHPLPGECRETATFLRKSVRILSS